MTRALGVALGGLLLTLIALTFNAAPLLVCGAGCAAVGLAAPLWVWLSARPVSITRRLEAERVMEGEPLEATIEIHRGLLGLPTAELHDPLAPAAIDVCLPLSQIRGAPTANVRIVTRFARRGLRLLPPPSLVVRDPIGLATVTRPGRGPGNELLVLPHTEPVRWRVGGGTRHSDGRGPSEPLAAVDVDGLRPYRPGTPASRIHWTAFARGAGLLERRLRQDADSRPLVVLDTRGDGPEEDLDAAVRAAASLALDLAKRGGCRILLPSTRRAVAIEADLMAWAGVHARLALVEGGPAERAPILDAGARIGPVFYVAAQRLRQLPAALATRGRGAVVLVLPQRLAPHGAEPHSFEVAGCHGFALRSFHGQRESVA